MREIKFRGKRIDNGEWVYGSLLKSWTGSKDIFSINEWPYDCEVDPDTVGQYTGLKDKNGKEIYEGDICKFIFDDEDSCTGRTYDKIYKIVWNQQFCQFELDDMKFHPIGSRHRNSTLFSICHMAYEIEIINNPESTGESHE